MKKHSVEEAIRRYDREKGPKRKIFGDSRAIRQLREILQQPEIVNLYEGADLPTPYRDQIIQIYSNLTPNLWHAAQESLTFRVIDECIFWRVFRSTYAEALGRRAMLDGLINLNHLASIATQGVISILNKIFNFLHEEKGFSALNDGLITAEQLVAFDPDDGFAIIKLVEHLNVEAIYDLLRMRKITLDMLQYLNSDEIAWLSNPNTAARILNEEIILFWNHEDGLRYFIPEEKEEEEKEHINIEIQENINNDQNTHTTSVHVSASETAIQLRNLYQNQIPSEIEIQHIWKNIRRWAMSLSEDPIKDDSIREAIDNIIEQRVYTDPSSRVTLRQLLAFSWIAIHDKDHRHGELSDALQMFSEGLYEIQRGYNIDKNGADDGGESASICDPGAFNKIIEKLTGVISVAEIHFVTMETFSLKLEAIIREEANSHLKKIKQECEEKNDLDTFKNIVSEVNQNGITHTINDGESIWDLIREQVSRRLFEEFGTFLFRNNPNSPIFINAINQGQYINFLYVSEEAAQLALNHIRTCLEQAYKLLTPSQPSNISFQNRQRLTLVSSLYDILLIPQTNNSIALLNHFRDELQPYVEAEFDMDGKHGEEKVAQADQLYILFSQINTILQDPETYAESVQALEQSASTASLIRFGSFFPRSGGYAQNDSQIEEKHEHIRGDSSKKK